MSMDAIELAPDEDRDYRPRYPLEKCMDNDILSYHLRDYDEYNNGMIGARAEDKFHYGNCHWLGTVVLARIEGMFYPMCLL